MPAAMRIVAGDALAWSAAAAAYADPTMSPTADALFPASNLGLADPGSPTRFGSYSTPSTITLDMDEDGGGGFEAAWVSGAPVNWARGQTGTGTVTEEALIVNGGTKAAKLTTGTGSARIYRNFRRRAGSTFVVWVWVRDDGTNFLKWRLENLTTGNAWNGSAWGAAALNTLSANSTVDTYTLRTISVTLEGYETSNGNDLVDIQLTLQSPTANPSSVYVDDFAYGSAVDLCVIAGHTITGFDSVTWRSDTAAFAGAGTLRGTFTLTPGEPNAYILLASPITDRYQRLLLTATNAFPTNGSSPVSPAFVNVLWAATQALTDTPHPGWETAAEMPQVRNVSRGGRVRASSLGQWAPRTRSLEFTHPTRAGVDELALDLMQRSRYGEHLSLVIPLDTQRYVFLCRPEQRHGQAQTFATDTASYHRSQLAITDEAWFNPSE